MERIFAFFDDNKYFSPETTREALDKQYKDVIKSIGRPGFKVKERELRANQNRHLYEQGIRCEYFEQQRNNYRKELARIPKEEREKMLSEKKNN